MPLSTSHQVFCHILSSVFGINNVRIMLIPTYTTAAIHITTMTFREGTNFILCRFIVESNLLLCDAEYDQIVQWHELIRKEIVQVSPLLHPNLSMQQNHMIHSHSYSFYSYYFLLLLLCFFFSFPRQHSDHTNDLKTWLVNPSKCFCPNQSVWNVNSCYYLWCWYCCCAVPWKK